MNCDAVANHLPLMLYDELSFDDEEAVQEHLGICALCRNELARLKMIHAGLAGSELSVTPQMLADARRTLRISVSTLKAVDFRPDRRARWNWFATWKPAAALILLAAGFIGGRLFGPLGQSLHLDSPSPEPMTSRVRFVQPEDRGRVQIVVEETRQRVLEGGVEDAAIKTLLLSAAREANDPGVRVETMDLLKTQSASLEVRRALLAALQHDADPGVRLKALEALRGNMRDGETRRVLAKVLLNDVNPGVRTEAVDLLTQDRGPDMVGVLQELVAREENDYVRSKCQQALRAMNASVESF